MIVIRNKIDKNLNSHFIKMDNNITLGHIYIIKLREFINNGEDVYKIGKTKKNNFNRFKNYPKGSRLLYYVKVNEYDKVEKIIIEIFKKKYKQRRDLGLEYFEEKFVEIETEINSIICNYTDDKMKYESKKDLLEYTNKEKKKVCSFPQTSLTRPKYSEENYVFLTFSFVYIGSIGTLFARSWAHLNSFWVPRQAQNLPRCFYNVCQRV